MTAEKASPYAFDALLKELPPMRVTGPWTRNITRGGTLPGSNLLRIRHTRRELRKLARTLEDESFDVIHAHNHPAQWIAAETRIPVVWTCNEPPYWYYYPTLKNKFHDPFAQWHDARVARRLHRILALDARMEAIIAKGYPSTPIERVGSGCELPGPLPESRRAQGKFQVISIVGGLYAQKRPLDAVRAVAVAQLPETVLHLVGTDIANMSGELQALARREGVDLRWHPSLSESDLLQLYADADAALFIPENQPWGIFPLEALLARVPVILSDEVGVRDVLPAGYPYVVKVGDTQAAGQLLRTLHADPAAAARAIQPAVDTVEKDLSWAACAERSLRALSRAAEDGPR